MINEDGTIPLSVIENLSDSDLKKTLRVLVHAEPDGTYSQKSIHVMLNILGGGGKIVELKDNGDLYIRTTLSKLPLQIG